ncbi:hypothetical protein Dxin01_00794 [Deinococcus xinjiangensis]|uniref:Uncharacterized protein n=1 Tax=Deinococcus xinjiangensis TaxID=457454 RepID=A0ABP9VAL4_9DEIO
MARLWLTLLALTTGGLAATPPLSAPPLMSPSEPSRVLRLQPGFWAVPLPAGVTDPQWPAGDTNGWALALDQSGKPALATGAHGETLIFVQVPPRGDDLTLRATIEGQRGSLTLIVDLIGFPLPPCKCLPHRP